MRLELRASPVLTLLTAAVHGAAAAVLWAYLPSPAGEAAALLVVLLALLVLWDRTLLRSLKAPAYLELKPESVLVIGLRSGEVLKGQVAARRYVSRWGVVLPLQWPSGKHRTILVAGDMLPAGEFRCLRLWALWNALPAASLAPEAR